VRRHLRPWLLLGKGPLKRPTDRLHALSRVVVLTALLAAVPAGFIAGGTVAGLLHGVARTQAAERTARTATLLDDAPVASSADGGDVLARGQWRGPHRQLLTGEVLAPAGTSAGHTVPVWIDHAGRITSEPLRSGDIAVQGITAGTVAALGLPCLVVLLHLLVVQLLDRVRLRRWTAEWTSVEPLWAGRTP
jgi:hypothetical protein